MASAAILKREAHSSKMLKHLQPNFGCKFISAPYLMRITTSSENQHCGGCHLEFWSKSHS